MDNRGNKRNIRGGGGGRGGRGGGGVMDKTGTTVPPNRPTPTSTNKPAAHPRNPKKGRNRRINVRLAQKRV
uniref:Uncharacterized protein n=1 Tax=Aegilops tauschii subsp. strangulata TaxID=200361 RepID=A0A453TD24_AEGTS